MPSNTVWTVFVEHELHRIFTTEALAQRYVECFLEDGLYTDLDVFYAPFEVEDK